MNRYEVIRGYFRFLKETRLPASEVILSAGAAMVVLGYRTHTSDLDVDVPEWLFVQHRNSRNFRRQSYGEFVAYNRKVSLQVNRLREGDVQVHATRLNGQVFTYTETKLLEQKLILLEQPNRSSMKAERDMADCDALINALHGQLQSLKDSGLYLRYQTVKHRYMEMLACL